MAAGEAQLLEAIARFRPVDGEWRPLDILLIELLTHAPRRQCLPVLFGVFESFPDDDGAGVLWTIVHGVESMPFDYEPELLDSLERAPSMMAQIMHERLEKSRTSTE